MELKKKVPEVRFKGFSGEWEEKVFYETFTPIPNNSLSRAELNYNFGLAKSIHYGDVLINYGELLDISRDEVPFVTDDSIAKKYFPFKLQNGDVVIADTAEDEAVGKCVELMNIKDEIVISGLHTISVRPVRLFSSMYLGYFMNSSSYHNQLLRLMQGTKVLSISRSTIKDTEIFFPAHTTEQSRIGTWFQHLDQLITLHQKKYNKLTKIKKAMLEKMFPKNGADVPEIRFEGFEGKWSVKTFGESFTSIPNNSLSRAELNYSSGIAKNIHYGDVLIKYGELLDVCKEAVPFITDDSISKKHLPFKLQEGDVIIADAAEDESVGKCTELVNVDNEIVVSGLHTICVRPLLCFSSKYLGYFLNSPAYHNQLLSLMQGTKVLSISKTTIKGTSILFPVNLKEQQKIGSYFQKLDQLITLQQTQIEKLKNIKKACLEKMFV